MSIYYLHNPLLVVFSSLFSQYPPSFNQNAPARNVNKQSEKPVITCMVPAAENWLWTAFPYT